MVISTSNKYKNKVACIHVFIQISTCHHHEYAFMHKHASMSSFSPCFYFPCSCFTIAMASMKATTRQKGKKKMHEKSQMCVKASVTIGIMGCDIDHHCLVWME